MEATTTPTPAPKPAVPRRRRLVRSTPPVRYNHGQRYNQWRGQMTSAEHDALLRTNSPNEAARRLAAAKQARALQGQQWARRAWHRGTCFASHAFAKVQRGDGPGKWKMQNFAAQAMIWVPRHDQGQGADHLDQDAAQRHAGRPVDDADGAGSVEGNGAGAGSEVSATCLSLHLICFADHVLSCSGGQLSKRPRGVAGCFAPCRRLSGRCRWRWERGGQWCWRWKRGEWPLFSPFI
jgi:hypothetical protein